jgi:hypothetical protein
VIFTGCGSTYYLSRWAAGTCEKETGIVSRTGGYGDTVTVTCYPDRELAQLAQSVIDVPDAQEESVAQTRSFSSMLLAVCWLLWILSHQCRLAAKIMKTKDRSKGWQGAAYLPLHRARPSRAFVRSVPLLHCSDLIPADVGFFQMCFAHLTPNKMSIVNWSSSSYFRPR